MLSIHWYLYQLVGDLNVNCLLYENDTVVFASSERELQALVTTLKEGCEDNGLSLIASKTEVERKDGMQGQRKTLNQVSKMVYPGIIDVKRRISASNRFNGALAALMTRLNRKIKKER